MKQKKNLFLNSPKKGELTHNNAYEFFEENTGHHKLPDVLKNLTPEDNPVITVIKLKE